MWATPSARYDVFVSYTLADQDFVRTLVRKLVDRGLDVWFDEGALRLGEGILRALEDGLEHSNYFLLVLSPTFFQGAWTQFETGVALSRVGQGHILAIHRGLDTAAVRQYSPRLAAQVAISADHHTIDEIADMICEVIQRERPEHPLTEV